MTASVFTKTLRDQRRGLLGWSVGTAATVALMAAIWPSFNDIDIDALLAQYPKALLEVFNVGQMSTGAGYLNAELFSLMLPAIFIVFAVGRGARVLAGEEEAGTLEVLVTLPVSRTRIIVEKAAALVVDVAALGAVLFVSTWLSSQLFGLDISVRAALNGAVAMALLGIEFGLVALAIGAVTGKRNVAVGASACLAGAAYLVYLAAQLVESLRPLRRLSPFYQAISGGPLDDRLPPIVWWTVAVGVVVFAASVRVFASRDLHV